MFVCSVCSLPHVAIEITLREIFLKALLNSSEPSIRVIGKIKKREREILGSTIILLNQNLVWGRGLEFVVLMDSQIYKLLKQTTKAPCLCSSLWTGHFSSLPSSVPGTGAEIPKISCPSQNGVHFVYKPSKWGSYTELQSTPDRGWPICERGWLSISYCLLGLCWTCKISLLLIPPPTANHDSPAPVCYNR